jgi:hypothetical protein
MKNFITYDSLIAQNNNSKSGYQENFQVGHEDEREERKIFPRKEYIKPTHEEIEIAPMEMVAMSGVGSDTEGDFEFGGRGESNCRRGEWGNLWC